jgi:hypothetical protein
MQLEEALVPPGTAFLYHEEVSVLSKHPYVLAEIEHLQGNCSRLTVRVVASPVVAGPVQADCGAQKSAEGLPR